MNISPSTDSGALHGPEELKTGIEQLHGVTDDAGVHRHLGTQSSFPESEYMGVKGDCANSPEKPSRCSREVEDASAASGFAITIGIPAGLVNFDRCTRKYSCVLSCTGKEMKPS